MLLFWKLLDFLICFLVECIDPKVWSPSPIRFRPSSSVWICERISFRIETKYMNQQLYRYPQHFLRRFLFIRNFLKKILQNNTPVLWQMTTLFRQMCTLLHRLYHLRSDCLILFFESKFCRFFCTFPRSSVRAWRVRPRITLFDDRSRSHFCLLWHLLVVSVKVCSGRPLSYLCRPERIPVTGGLWW